MPNLWLPSNPRSLAHILVHDDGENQPTTVLTPNILLPVMRRCCRSHTHTHTRSTGFFPRQQYYASLTTTHAVTRAFNFEKQKSTRAVFLSTDACTVPKVHPSDCLSPHPLSLRRTDRISELQKKAEGGDNRLYCLGIGNIAQSHSSEIFHDTSMCLSQVVGGPNSLLAEYHPTHSICLCMCASTARARAQGGEGDTGWLHLVG